MSFGTFVGVVPLGGNLTDARLQDLARWVSAELSSPPPDTQRLANVLFAQTQSEALFRGPDGRSLFVARARLDNRAKLGDVLRLSRPDLARISDAALLFRMFGRSGGDGIARCLGAFAFAHWDSQAQRLTLGRDCLGHASLFVHRTPAAIVFSNRIGALLAMPGVPREVDDIALAQLLVVNGHDVPRTAYRGIERIPSRTLVTIDRDGMRQRPYWSPNLDAPPRYRRDEDYVEHARELFDQAVMSATEGHSEVAVTTSGGLDSSAIAATVARQGRARRIHSYTTLPPDDADVPIAPHIYRDERAKVERLGQMYPALELNWLTRNGIHPFEEDESRYFELALVPRRGGVESLGGAGMLVDTLSAHPLVLWGSRGNLCLSWTGRFSLLALLRSREWTATASELASISRRDGKSRQQAFVSEIVRKGAPAALRMLWRKSRGRDPYGVAHYCALNPDFIAQNDLRRMWRQQGFNPGFRIDPWNPARYRAWYLFDRASADRDNFDWTEQEYGTVERDPFTDRRLAEFAVSVPEQLYCRNGVPRSFARAVFADRLPREILQETRRGANNLAWFRSLARRRPQIEAQVERMESSATARRLIDIPRLKRLLDDWPPNERVAESRQLAYRSALSRAVHVGSFICWAEGRLRETRVPSLRRPQTASSLSGGLSGA